MRWTNTNSAGTVLATYPSPECLIAIEHNHFVRPAAQVEDAACDQGPDCREELLREWDVCKFVRIRIVYYAHVILFSERREIQAINVWNCFECLLKTVIDTSQFSIGNCERTHADQIRSRTLSACDFNSRQQLLNIAIQPIFHPQENDVNAVIV